jgi:hypothetical protein
MNCKIGDLVWIPEKSRLLWARKEDKIISRTKITADPDVAVVVSEYNESAYCIFIDGDYWLIDKNEIYEVPNVSNARCS